MEIYESKGTFTINANKIQANIKTMLPNLKKGGKYEYLQFYNISTKDKFGLLGVLSIKGETNIDLNKYASDAVNEKKVHAKPVDLNDYEPILGGKKFSELTNKDSIIFVCFHEDKFEEKTISEKTAILKEHQHKYLPDFFKNDPQVTKRGILIPG